MAHTIHTASNGNLYIVIQSGDTLSEIADAYLNPYGKSLGCKSSSEYQTWLKNTNKIKNADLIYDGDKLILIKGYKITYYADGSTGAPGIQWKAYGQNLTLSRNKPTKAGYVFQGWNKNGLDQTTVDYAAGATYTINAAMSLYPVWSASTYTIIYNANGGTNAPASQPKNYNENITLSSDKPTRDGYEFVGWGTSASDILPTYYAGEKYTANANITLYAIWKFIYVKPKIENLSISRCDLTYTGDVTIGGNKFPIYLPEVSDSGSFGTVKFDWSSYLPTRSVIIEFKAQNATSWNSKTFTSSDSGITFNDNGKSGSASIPLSAGENDDGELMPLDKDMTYQLKITVTDAYGSTSITKILEGTTFTIDFANGGRGVGIGCIAPDIASGEPGVLEVGFQTKLTGGIAPVILPDKDLNKILTPGIYTSDNTIVYSNNPAPGTGTFALEVYAAGNQGQRLQRFTVCDKTKSSTYERVYHSESWGSWKLILSMPENGTITAATDFTLQRGFVTRCGTSVSMFFNITTEKDLTKGIDYKIGSISGSNLLPKLSVAAAGLITIGSETDMTKRNYKPCVVWVRNDGEIHLRTSSSETLDMIIEANLSWDVGSTNSSWT